ncbi:ATP-binding protein [Leucobacter sp. HY1910]
MTKTFKVKNYKRIEEVEITSGAGLVVLGGKNAQGKSSFLDGVRELVKFVGKRETPEPIRLGEKSAEVEIIDHERDRRYVRTFSRAKSGAISSSVGVYALDGARYENGAQIIAEDLGAEIIDAAQFAMLGARDQRDTLLRQVELPFDLDDLARRKKGVEDERKLANAEVKRLTGALASMLEPVEGLPEAEVSAAGIHERINAAHDAARAAADARNGLSIALEEVDRLEAELANWRVTVGQRQAVVDALPDEVADIAHLEEQLAKLDATNAAVRAAATYKQTAGALGEAQALAAERQAVLDVFDQKKKDALSAANFPDPLLSVDDEQVLYDGVPFTQVNSAKQIGIGFDIATLTKRELKLGFIKNGDLLDDESLAEIEARAIARGYTIIVERGRSGDLGYVFSEGEIVDVA